ASRARAHLEHAAALHRTLVLDLARQPAACGIRLLEVGVRAPVRLPVVEGGDAPRGARAIHPAALAQLTPPTGAARPGTRAVRPRGCGASRRPRRTPAACSGSPPPARRRA